MYRMPNAIKLQKNNLGIFELNCISQNYFLCRLYIKKDGWWTHATRRLWRPRRFPYWNPRDYFLEGILQTPHKLCHGEH